MKTLFIVALFMMLIAPLCPATVQGQYIYMLGDSITALTDFSDYISTPVKNRGICGATSSDVKAWLPYILGKDANKVFIMVGINDLGDGASPDTTAKRVGSLVDSVKKRVPTAAIYLQSVLPTRAGFRINTHIVSLNEQLKTMAYGKNIEFVDIHDFFTESDGITARHECLLGSVHLSHSGKQLWCSLLEQYIQ